MGKKVTEGRRRRAGGKEKKLLYIDLFCGAGGTSTGVNSARVNGKQCAEVISCVNHDANAIASHASNHPEALHFTEDIRTLDLSPLIAHVESCRKRNPEACFTLIARMDKMPPYLVSTKEGLAIEVYETDSPATTQIKEFMALYGIADIRMRMLRIPELKRIMGFPEGYVLVGTQAEQKKYR